MSTKSNTARNRMVTRKKNNSTKRSTNRRQALTADNALDQPSSHGEPAVVRLPPSFTHNKADIFPMHLRGTTGLSNLTTGLLSRMIALTPAETVTQTASFGLGTVFPVLNNIRSSFTEFMITRLTCVVTPVTPTTDVGFIAMCFEATDSARNAPPSSVQDASSGTHSAVATPMHPASITFNCVDYNEQWLTTYTSAADQRSEEAGVIQFYGANGGAAGGTVAIVTLELDIFFTGYRVA